MNLFKKLFPGAPAQPSSRFYAFAVQCSRCGENIEGHINLNNDLSAEYEGDRLLYHVRKVLMGSGLCFQQIEVELSFDASRHITDRRITGGHFLDSG